MSGGSYDYICSAYSIDELAVRKEALERMADRLEDLQDYVHLLKRTRAILARMEEIETAARRLHAAWHAVEWYDSSDWGEEQMLAVLEAEEKALILESWELCK